jgi:hypothetical protein
MPHAIGLLRAHRERTCSRRAAEHHDERAPLCMTGKEHFES